MSEANFWTHLRKQLPGRWQRITDRFEPGIADVAFVFKSQGLRKAVTGWLELKEVDSAVTPTGRMARFKLGLRPEQAIWLSDWGRWGARVGILVKVQPHDLLLFHGADALRLDTYSVTLPEWQMLCAHHQHGRVHVPALLWALEGL